MTRLKPLLAVAALALAYSILPASAAVIAPQAAHVDAAKLVSPMAEVRHRKKYRKRIHHRRRVVIGLFDGGWYYPTYRRHRYYVDDGYYYVPRRYAVRRGYCSDRAYYCGPHPQIGAWIFPFD